MTGGASLSPGDVRASSDRAVVALRHRDFRLLWAGQLVSDVGSHMQEVALAYQLFRLTDSPFQLGLLGLVRFAPVLLLALVGGAVADRLDRRRVLLVTQGFLGLSSAALALATQLDFVNVGLIYTVTFVSSIAWSFDEPAREGLIPRLVPHAHLPQATTLTVLAHEVGAVSGPAMGGVAIAAVGLSASYWFDAASFAVVVAALLAMRGGRGVATQPGEEGAGSVREGLRFVRRSPLILGLVSLDFLATFFGASLILLPIFADEILEVGPEVLGFLYAAPSAGSVATGLMLTALPPVRRAGRAVLAATVVFGVAIAVFGSTSSLVVAIVALGVSGCADTVSRVPLQAVRLMVTPDDMRGRVASVNQLASYGGWELGGFKAGMAAGLVGAGPAVVANGVLVVATAVGAWFLAPAVRASRIDRAASVTEVSGPPGAPVG